MTKLNLPELNITADGDYLTLQQTVTEDFNEMFGSETNSEIYLHLSQLAIIADRFMPKASDKASDAIDHVMNEHARLIKQLGNEIDELRDDGLGYFEEITKYCPSGVEISLHLRHLADLAYSLERDLLVLMPKSAPVTTARNVTERNERNVTGVTDNTDKLPGKAMSSAERQRAYRERKAAEKQAHLELSAATDRKAESEQGVPE